MGLRGPRAKGLAVVVIAWATDGTALEVVVPDDHGTIAEALDAVLADPDADDVVIVEQGTYEENVSLPDDVVLRGRETARTFLVGTGEGPVVSAIGTIGSRISNFTIQGHEDGAGMLVSAGSDLVVANNVFAVGDDNTAVVVEDIAAPQFLHNVFFRNGVALNAGGNALAVEGNAFIENAQTFVLVPVDAAGIVDNGFFDNEASALFGSGAVTTAPEFVEPDGLDFHLRPGSPYIDAATGTDVLDDTASDIGAYGGPHAEGVPVPVQDLEVTATGDVSVAVTWSDNPWYRLGGYKLHYDSDRSGTPYEGSDAAAGASPIDVGDVTSFTLEGLSPPGITLDAPVLQPAEPGDRSLALAWSEVESADGYIVHFGPSSIDQNSVDVGDVTRHTLSGLENGTTYRVAVSAYGRPKYFIAVSAYGDFETPPDSALSEEAVAPVGARVESLPSNPISEFPEPVVPHPDLPDENRCFIATAAYGSYGAREVQLLRRFRDRYLMTHAPGRAFIAWYYRHSPRIARALDANGWAKPFARALLLPAVALAGLAVHTSVAMKWLAASALVLLLGWGRGRRKEERL